MKTILTLAVIVALTGCATISDNASSLALAKDVIMLVK